MDLINEFYSVMEERKPKLVAFLTRDDYIYPLTTDTKVLSKAFESIARPIVYEIAKKYNYKVVEAKKQNFYPDFTLIDPSDDSKIAIDIKTAYRNFRINGSWSVKFTLGSYASFMRNETKNIVFPYSHYKKHYIILALYTHGKKSTMTIFRCLKLRTGIK